ncbi:MAG: hypothetical protein WA777_10740 [Rhodanobacter sp.]
MRAKDVFGLAIAAVLLLLTVPLYRHILAFDRAAADPAPSSMVAAIEAPVSGSVVIADRGAYDAYHEREMLAPNQRCVGGSVIQVDGSSYTQLGSIDYPIHCVGRVADRPLR